MNIKKFVVAAFCRPLAVLAALALSAMLVVGCSDDGDDEGGGDKIDGLTPAEIDNNLGAGASRLVGDWRQERQGNHHNEIWFLSFRASGDFYADCAYQKIDSFWLELCEGILEWQVSGNHIVTTLQGQQYSVISYTLSNDGNSLLIVDDRGDDYIWSEHFTKFNRNTLGTIRTTERALTQTYWRKGTSRLLIGVGWLQFTDDDDMLYDEAYTYTDGNRLFMIRGLTETNCNSDGGDCALVSEEIIEFTYTHTSGVSLRLRNISRGIDDLWEYQSWNDYMYKRPADTNRRANSLFGIGKRNARNGR